MPLLSNNKAKIDPTKLRVERVVVEMPPKPKPKPKSQGLHPQSAASSRGGSARRSPAALDRTKSKSSSPYPSSSDDRPPLERKRKLAVRRQQPRSSPATGSDRVTFDKSSDEDEDDGDWASALDASKRVRRAAATSNGVARRKDENRSLRHPGSFAPPERELRFIDAAQLAFVSDQCKPVLGAKEDEVAVELQYPSLHRREKYQLVKGKDQIDAVDDITRVVRLVADAYLTEDQARPFVDPNNGIARRLEKASNRNVQDLAAFKAALDDFNKQTLALVQDGTVARNLDARHELPRALVHFILEQVYDRTVAPKVELLAKYENGTDNVYGELLHTFISDILCEKTAMTSDQVFVDLGSGVGNVAIQAALEIGCESWGCEMMENACNLADAQHREFRKRCALWGLRPGDVHLERGDFRHNERVHEALKRADVILVNNQAFTSQLNDDLVRMFLDVKPGCRIVSLKSFVHDHKSASHNINDVGSTILDVRDLTYPEGYVSWTGAGGTYCISTRK